MRNSRKYKLVLTVLLTSFLLVGCEPKPTCPHFFVYADDGRYQVEHVGDINNYHLVGSYKTLAEAEQASDSMNKAANTKCEEKP